MSLHKLVYATDPTASPVVCSHYNSRPCCARAVVCIPEPTDQIRELFQVKPRGLLGFCTGSSHGYMHVRTEVAVAQVREWKNPTPSTGSLANLQNTKRASNDKYTCGEGSWTQWGTSPFLLHKVQLNGNKPLAKRLKSCIKPTTEVLADASEYFWFGGISKCACGLDVTLLNSSCPYWKDNGPD